MEIKKEKYNWEQLYPDTEENLLDTLEEGKILRYFVDESWVCLTKHENKVYAFKDKCPHAGASLFRANCEDGKVVCPIHQFGFSLKDGKGHGMYLENYPVLHQEGKYYIGFKKNFLGF